MGTCMSASADTSATKIGKLHGIMESNVEAAAFIGGRQGMNSIVELKFSCDNLIEGRSPLHPFIVSYIRQRDQNDSFLWKEFGRTEIISNSVSPNFVHAASVCYQFEEVQVIKLEIYSAEAKYSHLNKTNLDLSEQYFYGKVETTLATIFNCGITTWTSAIEKSSQDSNVPLGTITITGEELQNTNAEVVMSLRCEGLDNVDLFSKSDPFIRISKALNDGSFHPIFRTEVKLNNLNPSYAPVRGGAVQFANGDFNRPLKIEVLDYESNGKPELIGEVKMSLNKLKEAAMGADSIGRGAGIPLIHPEKQSRKRNYVDSGRLFVDSFEVIEHHSFLDYIRGGAQMSFIVAVDFTVSNGDHLMRESLHYVDPNKQNENQYIRAINAIGEVLEFYDHDQKFPVYGFGGKRPGGVVSHCFALNDTENAPEVKGVAGIISAYVKALNTRLLSGPTHFAPIINKAVELVEANNIYGEQKYFVLLILTDGMINDLARTVDAIIHASGHPLSVLIIGIGKADFKSMENLDADNGKLRNKYDEEASRDIVQFVAMRDYLSEAGGEGDRMQLVKAVLEEIPTQVVEYYERTKQAPRKPKSEEERRKEEEDKLPPADLEVVALDVLLSDALKAAELKVKARNWKQVAVEGKGSATEPGVQEEEEEEQRRLVAEEEERARMALHVIAEEDEEDEDDDEDGDERDEEADERDDEPDNEGNEDQDVLARVDSGLSMGTVDQPLATEPSSFEISDVADTPPPPPAADTSSPLSA